MSDDPDALYFRRNCERRHIIRRANQADIDNEFATTGVLANLMTLVRRGPPVEVVLTGAGDMIPDDLIQWPEEPCRQYFNCAEALRAARGAAKRPSKIRPYYSGEKKAGGAS